MIGCLCNSFTLKNDEKLEYILIQFWNSCYPVAWHMIEWMKVSEFRLGISKFRFYRCLKVRQSFVSEAALPTFMHAPGKYNIIMHEVHVCVAWWWSSKSCCRTSLHHANMHVYNHNLVPSKLIFQFDHFTILLYLVVSITVAVAAVIICLSNQNQFYLLFHESITT